MASTLAFAFIVYGVLVYESSKNNATPQERIYLHPDILDRYEQPYFVKISDMKPNSVGFFVYPSSYNYSDPANAYQRFMLIRMPSWLGGDKNDISSYRAYSMLDLESHCLIKYWPQYQRQNIEDACHFEMYRAIDGASYFFGIKFMSKPIENALPTLDLGVDDQGYIYVKPPTWTTDKNGIVGDGRNLSKEEILKTSETLLQDYQNITGSNINVPLELDGGEYFLIDVLYSKDGTQFRYTANTATTITPTILMSYCNCSASSDETLTSTTRTWPTQVWKFDDKTIYSYTPFDKTLGYYDFVFYENGYRISFDSKQNFSNGMKTLLDGFFNGTKMSDLKQIE